MAKSKVVDGVRLMDGSKSLELYESKDPDDHKKAARLMAYCRKAEKCNYDAKMIAELRTHYSDVL